MERFLILEDDVKFAAYIRRTLDSYGTTVVAYSVASGVSVVRKHQWTALLLDLVLPDGCGLDVLEVARDSGVTAPALVLTGNAHDDAINRAFQLDARILCKPIPIAQVHDFIRGALAPHASAAARRTAVANAWRAMYRLTLTEASLFREALEGNTSRDQLAERWGITEGTLTRHAKNLIQKTGDASLASAVERALREALMSAD
jgi:FixJ family two-component response regulator